MLTDTNTMTMEEMTVKLNGLMAELTRVSAENVALKQQSKKGNGMRVSEKGALSIYGLGRFPVTLYKEQWIKLLNMAQEIRDFLKLHDSELTNKADKK